MTDKVLRVLMIAPTPYFSDRGCHVRIYEEALALTKRGHEVCIVAYHLGRDMPSVRVERIGKIPWYRKLEAGPSWHKPYLDILLLIKAYTTARSFRPDIIHAHLHEGVLLGYCLKLMFRLPLLFDYQGSLSGESLNHSFFTENSLLHKMFKFLERSINGCADFIVTSSEDGRSALARDWGIGPEKLATLIDGVDTDVFKPFSQVEARRELGIPVDARTVVYLGLFNQYQGLDILLEVMLLVREKIEGIHFLLMGFPDEKYRKLAADMGIGKLITFTGRLPYNRAPFFLSAGDLAVSPKLARTEANGKLFNYMACGLPTVVFDSDVNREILGDDGVYAEYGSAASFAESIVTTMQNRELSILLSQRLRKRAQEKHSWGARARLLEKIYQNICGIYGH